MPDAGERAGAARLCNDAEQLLLELAGAPDTLRTIHDGELNADDRGAAEAILTGRLLATTRDGRLELTQAGQCAAAAAKEYRRAERAWSRIDKLPAAGRLSERMAATLSAEQIEHVVRDTDGNEWVGSPHLLVRAELLPDAKRDGIRETPAGVILQPDYWETTAVRPASYFVGTALDGNEREEVIEFQPTRTRITGRHYRLAQLLAGDGITWTAMRSKPGNPAISRQERDRRDDRGCRYDLVRFEAGGRLAGLVASYIPREPSEGKTLP